MGLPPMGEESRIKRHADNEKSAKTPCKCHTTISENRPFNHNTWTKPMSYDGMMRTRDMGRDEWMMKLGSIWFVAFHLDWPVGIWR
jgi:hypothetical protein